MLPLPDLLAVSDLALALISGGSAVVGSLIGGGITGFFALRGEKNRQEFARSIEQRKEEREDQATAVVARGAAREWARVLTNNRLSIKAAIGQGHWWPAEADVKAFAFHEDRKLVASILSPDDYAAVERAEFILYNHMMRRETVMEGLTDRDDLPPLVDEEPEMLRQAIERLGSAEQVLRAVGDRIVWQVP